MQCAKCGSNMQKGQKKCPACGHENGWQADKIIRDFTVTVTRKEANKGCVRALYPQFPIQSPIYFKVAPGVQHKQKLIIDDACYKDRLGIPRRISVTVTVEIKQKNKKLTGCLVGIVATGMAVVVLGTVISSPKKPAAFPVVSQTPKIEEFIPEAQVQDHLEKLLAPMPGEGETIADQIYDLMTYEVSEAENGACSITVKAPDMRDIFYSIFRPEDYSAPGDMEEYQSVVDDLLRQVEEKLTMGNHGWITSTVRVPCNENWEPEVNFELADALCGGMLSLEQELAASYMEGTEND